MQITTDLDIKSELHRILDQKMITPLFQPIVDLRRKCIFGYEALSRGPATSPLHMPDKLFCAARKHGMLFELDTLCRELCHYLQPCEPKATGEDILKQFQTNEELLAIPVVHDGAVLGICERHSLFG